MTSVSVTTPRFIRQLSVDTGRRRRQPTDRSPKEASGAGTGATVGKIGGPGRAMKGGIGTAILDLGNGVRVAALMAVNSVGNIVDPDTGQQVAGVRTADGSGDRRRARPAGTT